MPPASPRSAPLDKPTNNPYEPSMITALDIEKALERLPEQEQRKVAEWFDDHRLIVASSASLSAIYDEEDGGENQLTGE